MRRVFLVRHGQTAWNALGRFQGQTDVELDEIGREQALAVAEKLASHRPLGVASSDLRRARETAEILAARLAVPLVHVDPDLRERGYGCFEGLTRAECEERWPDLWNAHMRGSNVDIPGAEVRALVVERVVRAVTRVVETHARADRPVVVVTHGGVMRVFLEAATGTRVPPVPNTAVYEVLHVDDRFVDPRLL